MKLSKFLLILVVTLTVISCKKKDDDTVQFVLTNANVAGLHDLTYFVANIDQAFEINGIPVTSNTSVVGDTFQVVFNFNENGTYTADGQYRIVTTITVGGVSETDEEIIVFDETGTFTTNANTQTMTFDGNGNGDLGEGEFNVSLFNENEIRLTQSRSEVVNGVTADSTIEIRLVRQ